MRHVIIVAVLAFVAVVARLAGANDLTGSGEWRSLRGESIRGRWSARLSSSGEGLSGTFVLDGSNVLRAGEVEGTLSGGKIVLGIVAEGQHVASFAGTMSEEGSVSGEWEFEALGDSGVWEGAMRAQVGAEQ